MKPVWLVDQDGPLAAFDTRFWNIVRDLGIPMDCQEHEQTGYYATEHVQSNYDRRWLRRKINEDTRWFADLPATPGAVEGINLLTEHADVWICTKPLEANPNCRDGKAEWVRKHLGKDWERRIIIAPDKSLVMGALLLDDRPKREWFARAVWNPVLFPVHFNTHPAAEWGDLPRWTWGDPIEDLVAMGEPF